MTDQEKLAFIMDIAESYAGIDGGHHKQWALTSIIKIIQGDNYTKWVEDYQEFDEDGDYTYDWDEGTPG